jgi:biopolymer transport protein TolR
MALPSRMKGDGDLYQPLADINVTPLVDVMLVLLIIFMVTAPLLAKGVKVNLPQARAAQPLNQKDPIVVTVGKEGKISLGTDEVTPDALIDGIHAMMGEDVGRVVHVRGDTDAVYGEVVAVMDKLATNGITHIAIMTNSRGRNGAQTAAPAAPVASTPAASAPAAAPAAPAAPAGVPPISGGPAK